MESKINELSSKIDELINQINNLRSKQNEFENEIKQHINDKYDLIETLETKIEKKIDIIANIDKNITTTNSITSSSTVSENSTEQSTNKKKETPLSFLHRELKTDIDKYVDILYSDDDVKLYSQDEKITSTNGATAKRKKLISLIYNEVIKPNKDAMSKLSDIMNK